MLGCERAAAAAEFALVLPITLLLVFGIIDVGRFMYIVKKKKKHPDRGRMRSLQPCRRLIADYAAGRWRPTDPADELARSPAPRRVALARRAMPGGRRRGDATRWRDRQRP